MAKYKAKNPIFMDEIILEVTHVDGNLSPVEKVQFAEENSLWVYNSLSKAIETLCKFQELALKERYSDIEAMDLKNEINQILKQMNGEL